MDVLKKSTKTEIVPYRGTDMVRQVVQGERYGEDYGYRYWWELKTIDKKTYKLTQELRDRILPLLENRKFLQLGEDTVPVNQIKGITLEKEYFGPREGSY